MALQTQDFQSLKRRAHQLKGGSKMMAIRWIPDLAEQLEEHAQLGQRDLAQLLIQKLEKLLAQMMKILKYDSDSYLN